VTSFLF
jgi:hypothetical protein